jgi:hypothetical protein
LPPLSPVPTHQARTRVYPPVCLLAGGLPRHPQRQSRRASTPTIPSKSQFFPARHRDHPPHIPFLFFATPRLLVPPSKPPSSPPLPPFCDTNYDRGFLPPMQHVTPSAARFHRRKRRNSESRSTVQGLTIALTATKKRRKLFLIYGKPGVRTFHLRATRSHLALRLSVANHEKINRKPGLIEPLVSHSKQMTSQKSIGNFPRVRLPHFHLSFFHFPSAIPTPYTPHPIPAFSRGIKIPHCTLYPISPLVILSARIPLTRFPRGYKCS